MGVLQVGGHQRFIDHGYWACTRDCDVRGRKPAHAQRALRALHHPGSFATRLRRFRLEVRLPSALRRLTWPVRELTGITPDILSTPLGALLAVAFVDVWQWGLFFAVIILKLLESLPPQPLEAARIDKATRFEIHRFVTLPMLKAPLISLLLVKAIESLRSFDLVYVMTRGGPGISTETLDMYAYSQGFIEAGKISYASSMAVIMMVLTIVTFTFTWKRLNR